jgi:hypothetical protein
MNLFPAVSLFLPLLSAALCAMPLAPACALDKVAVTAQVHPAPHAKEAKDHESQGRILEITVGNHSHENLTNLKVKWTFFGFDLKDDEVVVAEAGTLKCSLPPNGDTTLSSKPVEFNFTRAHAQKTAGKPGKSGAANQAGKAKQVPASGARYAGWAVQVYQADGVVGEAFSRPDLKDKL